MISSVNILDFGAKGDGITNDSRAIQKAIDECCLGGGGTVVVPAGRYKTGTLWLKSNVELHLSHGAVLLASENMDDYNALDAYEQNFSYPDEEWVGKHLIIALFAENVAITGFGVIDGNGHLFYGEPEKRWRFLWADGLALSKDKGQLRPGQLICFIECSRVKVQDIQIRNATCWCCFFHGCENVQVRGITVNNKSTYANTDGIDIDCCRYVTVSDCIIDTGDDAIAVRGNAKPLKSVTRGSEYITISNCVLGSSSAAFRIGVGDREIKHVRISNITVTRAATAFILMSNYFQSEQRYTPMSDISFSDISLTETMRVFEILAVENGPIRNVSFNGIYCETYGGSYIASEGGRYLDNIRLENFRISVQDIGKLGKSETEERGKHVLEMQNVGNGMLKSMQIAGAENTLIPWDEPFISSGCELSATDCSLPCPIK